MAPERKLALAKQKKESGNSWYSSQRYNYALKRYQKVLEYLKDTEGEGEEPNDDKMEQEVNDIRLSIYSNMAAVYLETKEFKLAEENCNKVHRWIGGDRFLFDIISYD